MTRVRAAVVAIAILVVGLPGAGFPTPAAGAATLHRAMVVVDTGTTTYRQVVTFTSDSVTGIQALQLAGANPVVYSYAGQGGAVCRLFGVGRDAGPSCLGGADGDNRYWAYFRAPAGTTTFTYSRAGGGATQVHDGDVEGWRFGTGEAPAYAALPPTTTTTLPVPPPAAGGTGPAATGPAGAPAAPGAPQGAAPLDPQALQALQDAATSTTSTTSLDGRRAAATARHGTEVEAKRASRGSKLSAADATGGDGGGGGSAASLAIFAVVATALVGGGLLLRRARRRPVP
jgi:hypothetical protein